MPRYPFSIANVFAESAYAGNHVTVVRGAAALSDERMQAIAWEIGPAAFLMSDTAQDRCYPLRVFTPAREIMYCGHPVLGAAHVIQTELLTEPVAEIVIAMPKVQMTIGLRHEGGALRSISIAQEAAVFGPMLDRGGVVRCLRDVSPDDLDPAHPVQEVSTGIPYVMVPVRTLEALRRLSLDSAAFARLTAESEAKMMLLFALETINGENDVHMRVFADYYGVPEDPGTGSAGGALGAYLIERDIFGAGPLTLRVEQGHAIHRPSLLEVAAARIPEGIAVTVSGQVIIVGRGELE
jgi:trans-2,3-dihydro-3-hydroxyanthranilate isomerase